MLYSTMESNFGPSLLVWGVLAVIFAALTIRIIYSVRVYPYASALALCSGLLCTGFALQFIRITTLYPAFSLALNYAFRLIMILAGVLVIWTALWCLNHKSFLQKLRHTDILDDINDRVLVYDRRGEVVFSTCPQGMAERIDPARGEGRFELEWEGCCYLICLSPILKGKTVIGMVGSVNDITAEKTHMEVLSQKIEKLSYINEVLLQEVGIDDTLLVAKHRKQLSLNIQKNIDEKIRELIKQIGKIESGTERNSRLGHLTELADSLRCVLADIRKIVYGK